jgi:hypothetical protein
VPFLLPILLPESSQGFLQGSPPVPHCFYETLTNEAVDPVYLILDPVYLILYMYPQSINQALTLHSSRSRLAAADDDQRGLAAAAADVWWVTRPKWDSHPAGIFNVKNNKPDNKRRLLMNLPATRHDTSFKEGTYLGGPAVGLGCLFSNTIITAAFKQKAI